ncbi:hypothetical protein [Chryseobacterium wangxinyae]|uniref:hypothetical protein n=1 Tax=Chryseobacterium sp. CY353 TaxID=2997334 RepID=UPI00226DC267|nr:hypothetical protein [Chryseobacterium sp. CY353]MCY0971102.1 hypothetical protein [Chryseobacterium sp. CY353]
MGWLIGNNKRAFAEKLMKDIRAREERENVDVIGDVSPEIQEKRASQNLQEKNSKKMQEVREEREKEDDKQEGQLLAIHGAKVKFNAHIGEFKVLNDVPTTQGKLTGTIVEKQIPNFTFYDGFQMLSLTKWQDFGTVNVQNNFALLKKSTLPGTGKMQGNVPPESGKIEFVDSGQVNIPESITTTGAPVPENLQDEKCYCNRDFTEEEIKTIIQKLRETEKIKTTSLFYDENCPLPESDKTYKRLYNELNSVMNKHNINTCIRKIHFLAQSYHESSRYGTTLEYSSGKKYNPGNHSDAKGMEHTIDGDGPRYKGRGIIQLTWRKTQKKYFSYVIEKEPQLLNNKKIDELFDRKPLYKEKYIYYKDKVDANGKKILNKNGKPAKEKVVEIVDVDSASLIASNLHFAFDSAGWYWENLGKTVPTGENINLVADTDDVLRVSQCINGKVKNPYGLKERKEFTKNLKLLFKYDEVCVSKKK